VSLDRFFKKGDEVDLSTRKCTDALKKLSSILPLVKQPENDLGYYGVQNPWSVIDGRKVKIHEMVLFLVTYYCRKNCVIFDPTCGKENYQFKPILEVLEALGYRYISADLEPYGDIQHDVLGGVPLRDDSVDIILYDPPYVPYSRCDVRGEDYAISSERCVYDVKKFYSKEVLKEFHRILRRNGVLIVKGTDFYEPTTTDNLFLFLVDVVPKENYRGLFRYVALYVYRYFHKENILNRYRLKRVRRPVLTHTYFLVLKKE